MAVSFIIVGLLFILGTAVGSFLNVLIYRSIRDQSWVVGRSRCDHCGKQISWFDNVPIFSYIWLKGKTRCCHKPIPLSYPVVELMTGTLFAWWYLFGFLFFRLTSQPLQILQPLFWLLVGVLLVVIFVADLLYMIIPNSAVIMLLVATILYRGFLTVSGVMQPTDLLNAVLGVGLAVGTIGGLWALTKGKGMGLGDVKYVVPMALLLGWPNIVVGLFISFMLGGLISLLLLLTGKRKVGQTIPFGPFLVLATVISLLWGDPLFVWYVSLLS